jgi:hypothetical protein
LNLSFAAQAQLRRASEQPEQKKACPTQKNDA